jgi:hypothetical protein
VNIEYYFEKEKGDVKSPFIIDEVNIRPVWII